MEICREVLHRVKFQLTSNFKAKEDLIHAENLNLGKDFQHGQKMKACILICVNELWLLNKFLKNDVLE